MKIPLKFVLYCSIHGDVLIEKGGVFLIPTPENEKIVSGRKGVVVVGVVVVVTVLVTVRVAVIPGNVVVTVVPDAVCVMVVV
jgi:hypothetical protein